MKLPPFPLPLFTAFFDIMSNNTRYGLAVLAANKETLKRFRLHQNVIIHDTTDRHVKHYGTVAGFQLNCFGELCVKFNIAVYDMDEAARPVMILHPENGGYNIEIIE